MQLFCSDLTSIQIAEVAKNAINLILQLLRRRIVEIAEAESYFEVGEIEANESCFGSKLVCGKRRDRTSGKMPVCWANKKKRKSIYDNRPKLLWR